MWGLRERKQHRWRHDVLTLGFKKGAGLSTSNPHGSHCTNLAESTGVRISIYDPYRNVQVPLGQVADMARKVADRCASDKGLGAREVNVSDDHCIKQLSSVTFSNPD